LSKRKKNKLLGELEMMAFLNLDEVRYCDKLKAVELLCKAYGLFDGIEKAIDEKIIIVDDIKKNA